jgi:hypothetical protein
MKGRWKLKKDLAIKMNLDLLNEFLKYAFEKPEILEEIPPDAELIILPVDDPNLYEYKKTAAQLPEHDLKKKVWDDREAICQSSMKRSRL